VIVNSGFETTPLLSGWEPDVYNDGNYYSTITANSTIAHTGSYSARLDVSNNSTAFKIGAKNITLAHLSLVQYLPPNTFFNNVTDRPDGLNLWFYLQPKFAGYPIFEVRIRTGGIREMDYIFVNPSLANTFSFPNSTTGSEGGKPLKEFLLPAPPINQWVHLSRNLKQDWLAPMKLSNGLTAPGLPLNDTIYRLEVDAYFYRDSSTNNVYAETGWVDDVALYLGNPMSLQNFNFQDKSGNSVDGNVNSMIVDASGAKVSLAVGSIVPSGSYSLRAYYQGFLILTYPITPATPAAIQLQMVPTSTTRSNYLVFNSTIISATVVENSSSRIVFSVVGTGPSLIIVKVPVKPLRVDRDGNSIPSWTYNSTTSVVAIQTARLGTFTLVFSNEIPSSPLRLYVGLVIAGALAVIASALLLRRRFRSRKSVELQSDRRPGSKEQFKPKSKKSQPRL
jgi:hypothetical protein